VFEDAVNNSACVAWNDNMVIQQDRQCTYNVTLMRVRATIVAVEKL